LLKIENIRNFDIDPFYNTNVQQDFK